ncbi:hypothetical protein GGR58DRAFT_514502 [Xylaria digitata]|nr:hypothetical protein GGR58DRAFT_514502 [Xylaria digitata]
MYMKDQAGDMEAALKLISGDLYQNSIHFLLELVQNSDDSEFQESDPVIKITYHNRTIRFDTNEVGFRRRDVEAICSVGNSFKKESGQRKRRIGEKGIGFKSVFGVADEVFIASGYYSFRFTTQEPLGMLAPICSPFPGDILAGRTSILLQLSPNIDIDELIRELKKLDGRILMFLQKIKHIELEIVAGDGSVTEIVLQQKAGHPTLSSGNEICAVEPDSLSPYLIFRHTVSQLPTEGKRADWNETEIVLAFPMGLWDGTSLARLSKPNNVYAFLPIRDYGFQFVLHADFILLSSREEIDPDSEWNKSLHKQIPRAFLRSVVKLQDSSLQYLWPYYVPLRPKIDNFFQDVWLETLKLLSQHPTLESVYGTLLVPSALLLVPKEFSDSNGQPLIPIEASKFTYISPSYPVEAWHALSSLGVKILSAEDFLDNLSSFVTGWPDKFQSMPANWHSSLARALDPLVIDHEERIKALPFIQLRDGALTSPDSGLLLFPATSHNMAVPQDICASVVHIDAASDHSRRILLQKLGAQIPDKESVCRIILETHRSEDFDLKVAQNSNLIRHAEFLHRAGWSSESPDDTIWLVAEDGSRHHGYSLYLSSDDPYSTKQILSRCTDVGSLNEYFLFLHSEYSSSFPDYKGKRWLQKTLGLSEVPRLVSRSQQSTTYTIDPGLKLLPRHLNTVDILQMLRINWAQYQQWIAVESPRDADIKAQPNPTSSNINEISDTPLGADPINLASISLRKEIRRFFSEMSVSCWDGYAKLSRTSLPRKRVLLDLNISGSELKGQVPSLDNDLSQATEPSHGTRIGTQVYSGASLALFPVLEVPVPEDPTWDFLKQFGVIVKVTARELVVRLESLQERAIPSRILRIYGQIQACAGDDEAEFLRRKFQNSKLVYMPEECAVPLQGSRWVPLDACVWDGPTCLKKFPRLRNFYSELEDLFCSKLKVTTANLNTLIAESMLISSTDSLPYIRSLFKQLSHMSYGTYYHTRYDAKFYGLLELDIVPVWTGKRGFHFDELRGSRMAWYIADAPYMLDSFEGKLPLLAFEPPVLKEMKDLITNLGWENRRLRKLAVKELSIEGFEKVDYKYTQSLQDKWRCIARLLPTPKSDRVTVINQLRSVQVFEAEGICVSWKVTNSSGDIFPGKPERGRAMLATDGEILKLYLTKEDMKIGCPPLELIDELARFCGIEVHDHIRLLSHILIQDDIGRIEMDLDRRFDRVDTMQLTLQPIFEMPAVAAPSIPIQNILTTDIKPAASKLSSVHTATVNSSSVVETEPEPEPRATSPTQLRSGRQKLEYGWRSKVYGSKALSQHSPTRPSKEKHAGKSGTSKGERSNTISKDIFSSGSIETFEGEKKAAITGSSAHSTARPRRAGRLKGSNNETLGLVSLSMPILAASRYRQIEEIKFIAELYVAGALSKIMESNFIEQKHWTSYLRTRAGHKPHDSEDSRVSTFTLPDTNGRLANYLTEKGYANGALLAHDSIFHIQVVHSFGPVGSMFNIGSDQVEKARLLSQTTGTATEQKEVFTLAYVYNIVGQPEVALYPDPWHLHVTGLLSLEAYHDQEGRLDDTAPAVHIQSFVPTRTLTTVGTQDGRFKYENLNLREIRILDLSPGQDDEPLQGVIRHVPISHVGIFRAISYVWGADPSEINPYYLFTPQGTVLLNFSLRSALKALRKGSTISVWADGICINQKNPREKALQISMLGEIFQAAEQVTAWLGHAYNGSEDAMRVLSQIRPASRDYPPRADTAESAKMSKHVPGKVPDLGEVTWKHINSLLRRPWFTRVWITQELVLPRRVVLLCGELELDWDQFFEALTICEGESNRVSRQTPEDIQLLPDAGPAYALGLARNRQKKEGKRFSLLKWFEIFEHAEASIEVDKLFAFLGLAHDSDGEEFMPDYESTLEEVVRRYAKGLILQDQVMGLLYRAGISKSYEFCSWIPRWTRGQFPRTISTWDSRGGPFRAGTPSAPIVNTTDERIPESLTVDGYVVDVIHSTHPIKWGSGSSLFFFDAMVNFKSLLSFVNKYPTGESIDDLLLQLPIGNAARPHLESDVDKERSYRSFATQENSGWPPNLRELILSVDNDQDPSKYLHMPRWNQVMIARYWQTAIAFSRRLGNAVFCFTKDRYVGLVPEAAAAGDQVCLFHGGNVPFVLRKKGPAYTLVGECYIQGIMNGQALQRPGLDNHSFILV